MTSNLWSAMADFARNAFTPRHEKLGVPKDFPLNTFVYLSPDRFPVKDVMAQCRYLLASYQGGDTWKIDDLECAMHELGTDTLSNGSASYMTSRQLVNTFDCRLAEHPGQSTSDYGSERHYTAARQAIIDRFVPSMVTLDHKAA